MKKSREDESAELIEVVCSLLALCFKNKLNKSERIVSLIFEYVYNQAAIGKLEFCWTKIAKSIPESELTKPESSILYSWFGIGDFVAEWDKCERLIRAIAESFVRYKWELSYVLLTFDNSFNLDRFLDYCNKSTQGRHLIKNLLTLSDSNSEVNKYRYFI